MTNKKLIFISRHNPNDGQIALAKEMKYDGIKKVDITFTKDPITDLKNAGITEKTIAIVAPSYITNQLLNAGYTLIEFVNSPVKREKMVFCCKGAYIYKLDFFKLYYLYTYIDQSDKIFEIIKQKFIKCPISIEEQAESSLIPK